MLTDLAVLDLAGGWWLVLDFFDLYLLCPSLLCAYALNVLAAATWVLLGFSGGGWTSSRPIGLLTFCCELLLLL